MSVYSLMHPDLPVELADELESFLHVLMYLAVRFLHSSLLIVSLFVDEYFKASRLNQEWRTVCGEMKRGTIFNGRLRYDTWDDLLTPLNRGLYTARWLALLVL